MACSPSRQRRFLSSWSEHGGDASFLGLKEREPQLRPRSLLFQPFCRHRGCLLLYGGRRSVLLRPMGLAAGEGSDLATLTSIWLSKGLAPLHPYARFRSLPKNINLIKLKETKMEKEDKEGCSGILLGCSMYVLPFIICLGIGGPKKIDNFLSKDPNDPIAQTFVVVISILSLGGMCSFIFGNRGRRY